MRFTTDDVWRTYNEISCTINPCMRTSGRRLRTKLTSNQLSPYTDAAGYRRSEYVTVTGSLLFRLKKAPGPLPPIRLPKSLTLVSRGNTLPGGDWNFEGESESFTKLPLQSLILQAP